jgi:hypothetical protein
MDCPYTVALRDGEALPCAERIAAECRFIIALEAALGAPDAIVATYMAWMKASESQADIEPQTATAAERWPMAYQRACEAGMRGVHGVAEAAFDFKPEQSA